MRGTLVGAMAGEDCGQETNTHYRQSPSVFIEIKGMGGEGKKKGKGGEREGEKERQGERAASSENWPKGREGK